MRWSEIIEGRHGGVTMLYHATDLESAVEIIRTGGVEGRTGAVVNGRPRKGLSLTRSRGFAKVFYSVAFGFDADALRRRYGGRLTPHADPGLGVTDEIPGDHRREAEEFLMVDRLPLDPFLRAIWVSDEVEDLRSSEMRGFVRTIQDHPLYAGINTAKFYAEEI